MQPWIQFWISLGAQLPLPLAMRASLVLMLSAVIMLPLGWRLGTHLTRQRPRVGRRYLVAVLCGISVAIALPVGASLSCWLIGEYLFGQQAPFSTQHT